MTFLNIRCHNSQDLKGASCYQVVILSVHFVKKGNSRSIRFTKTIEPGDRTAVRFKWVFNNDVINKNTAVRFTWLQTLVSK